MLGLALFGLEPIIGGGGGGTTCKRVCEQGMARFNHEKSLWKVGESRGREYQAGP